MCVICDSDQGVKHYSLYVNGSEGIVLCESCQMGVVEYIRQMQRVASRAKKQMILRSKNLKRGE